MTDDARRDRVKDAIQYASWSKNDWYVVPDKVLADLADAAIAAVDEPEPTPQLLVDMAQAIRNTPDTTADHRLDEARAALRVVVNQEYKRIAASDIATGLGIPESMVREMLDE